MNWKRGRPETECGRGSTLEYTLPMRIRLQALLTHHEVRTLTDAGCGDFNWMSAIDLTGISYLGLDREKFPSWGWHRSEFIRFQQHDIIYYPLPAADLTLCRDVLFHHSLNDCRAFLKNFERSGSLLLLMSNSPGARNAELLDGRGFARRDFCNEPFNLPAPAEVIHDGDDRQLYLWRRESLL